MSSIVRELSEPLKVIEYHGDIVASNTTDQQSWIVLKTQDEDECLFIDNQFQSSKIDEYIYHETFVHSLLCCMKDPKKVLILGGAEGCLAREVLKWSSIERVVQVDWDGPLISYFQTFGEGWNGGAYRDPRLEVIVSEAVEWLQGTTEVFDAIFIDLLDPTDDTMPFFNDLLDVAKKHLAMNGALSIQAGKVSNLKTPGTLLATMVKKVFSDFHQFSYKAIKTFVPSYHGEWCFLMVLPKDWMQTHIVTQLPEGLKRFSKCEYIYCSDSFHASGIWPKDYPQVFADFWDPSKKINI